MQFVVNQYTSPNENLALEEILFQQVHEEYIILWQNTACVVVGKHQVLAREVHLPHAHKLSVPLSRRLSGGGTVFHDAGNINFTFILNASDGLPVKFRTYMQPIVDYLNKCGVPAVFSDRNDIMVHGRKISGNAEHVRRNRVIHHGTLLFNSDLQTLNQLLHHDKSRYQTRGIQSVSSKVSNISEHIFISQENFKQGLIQHLLQHFNLEHTRDVSSEEFEACKLLAANKYKTDEWLYGNSPEYTFHNKMNDIEVEVKVKNGIIESITGNIYNPQWQSFLQQLPGTYHIPRAVIHKMETQNQGETSIEDILQLLF